MPMTSRVVQSEPALRTGDNANETAFSPARHDIVAAIATLPDEAFGFLCGVLDNVAHTAGGFREDSRVALMAIAPLVRTYFASVQGK